MDASTSRQYYTAKTRNFNLQLSVPMNVICVCMLLTETCHIPHSHDLFRNCTGRSALRYPRMRRMGLTFRTKSRSKVALSLAASAETMRRGRECLLAGSQETRCLRVCLGLWCSWRPWAGHGLEGSSAQ